MKNSDIYFVSALCSLVANLKFLKIRIPFQRENLNTKLILRYLRDTKSKSVLPSLFHSPPPPLRGLAQLYHGV